MRATMMDVWLEALPPGCEMPPACGPVKPKRAAKARAVVFSIRVRTGET